PVWITSSSLGSVTGSGIASNQGLNVTTTINATPVLSSLNLQQTTLNSATPQVMVNLGLNATQGSSDGLPLRVDVLKTGGSGDVAGIVMNLQQNTASGSYNAQGIEANLNNNNANRGDADGAAGLVAPVSANITVTGSSSFRKTAGILVNESPGALN